MNVNYVKGVMYALLLTLVITYSINQAAVNDFISHYLEWFSLLFVMAVIAILYSSTQVFILKRWGLLRFESGKSCDDQSPNNDTKRPRSDAEKSDEYKRRTEFLVNLSHDLCAPIYAILGYTDLLFKTDLTEKQKNYIGAIKNTGGFVIDLAREISLYRTLDKDDIEINKQQFTVGNVIGDVLEVMGRKASVKNIDLVCINSSVHEATCTSDPFRIRQILLNLVGNAIKFTEQGYVKLKVDIQRDENQQEQLYFEVIDTGIGICAKDYDKIFSPFCQLNYEHTENIKQSGSGLGLTINMRLVSAMGGKIGVESKHGKGTKFWVKIPCENVKLKETAKLPKANSKTRKALVIDSNKVTSNSLRQSLNYFGFSADIAKNTREIRALLTKAFNNGIEYDVIFIASHVDNECGLQIAKNIRSIIKYNATPLVITVPITEQLAVGVVSSIQPAICLDKPVIPYKLRDLMSDVIALIEPDATDSKAGRNNKLFSLPRASGKKILIVDDNPTNRNLLLEMFKEIHITASAVEDGETALSELSARDTLRYDIVLLDCLLPGVNGYAITRQIRKLNLDRQPVIIMSSANTSMQNKLMCYKSGADEFMEKPITIKGLVAFLETWFPEKKEAEDGYYLENINQTVVNIFDAPILDDGIVGMMKKQDTGNTEFVNNMYAIFVEETSKRIEKIISHLKKRQYAEISKTAHSIKSGCLQFGARGMSIYCDVLGNMARLEDHQQIENTLEKLVEEYSRVMDKFESYQENSKIKH